MSVCKMNKIVGAAAMIYCGASETMAVHAVNPGNSVRKLERGGHCRPKATRCEQANYWECIGVMPDYEAVLGVPQTHASFWCTWSFDDANQGSCKTKTNSCEIHGSGGPIECEDQSNYLVYDVNTNEGVEGTEVSKLCQWDTTPEEFPGKRVSTVIRFRIPIVQLQKIS